ncbi:olfactory receptor 1J2-like [Diceros bicornis minor]|uniref:olfactory receptor 1J2-like n=1 Tax=Diceros bicornis minor TaxID=77932 RepID=UPI0026F2007F|nr:olfactory receptor 1J2-like [Diceros bicornis minor]
MIAENLSSVSEFLLQGLPILPEHQGTFFTLFLGMYLTTVPGNLLIILLVRLDSHLHTSVYFFLSHLSITDISFSSITVPKIQMNMQTHCKYITHTGCILKAFFFIIFRYLDGFLLAVMASDRYVAICYSLHYTNIMRVELCLLLVIRSCVLTCAIALSHTLLLVPLCFCVNRTIPRFLCDLAVLLKLSCSETSLSDLIIFILGVMSVFLPLSGILFAYVFTWGLCSEGPLY